MRIMQLIQI